MEKHLDTILDVPCFTDNGKAQSHNDPDLQRPLIRALWPTPNQNSIELNDFRAYLHFLKEECHNTRLRMHVATTFLDLIRILDIAKQNADRPMVQLRHKVRELEARFETIDDRRISMSIELAVRLCYMVNVRSIMPSDSLSLRSVIAWPEQQSLKQVMENYQWQSSSYRTIETETFPTVPDLIQIGGLKVRWTDDIMDHLKVDGRTLLLFKHISVLEHLRSSQTEHVLSDDLVVETLRTFDVLLPVSNPACNDWMSHIPDREYVDPNINFRLGKFEDDCNSFYWKARLCHIADVYDKALPTSLYQLWHDQRDMPRWWTFWLVILTVLLTLLFGLIQSITGIIQVVASFNSK